MGYNDKYFDETLDASDCGECLFGICTCESKEIVALKRDLNTYKKLVKDAVWFAHVVRDDYANRVIKEDTHRYNHKEACEWLDRVYNLPKE